MLNSCRTCVYALWLQPFCHLPPRPFQHPMKPRQRELLVVTTWACRYIHIALDTVVLYGVLGARNVDERSGIGSSSSTAAGTDPGGVGTTPTPVSSGFRILRRKAFALTRKSSRKYDAASSRGGGSSRKAKVHSEGALATDPALQWA